MKGFENLEILVNETYIRMCHLDINVLKELGIDWQELWLAGALTGKSFDSETESETEKMLGNFPVVGWFFVTL